MIMDANQWLRENLLSWNLVERFGVRDLLVGLFMAPLVTYLAWGVISLAYSLIVRLVNRTVITVTGTEMSVKEGPASHRRNTTLPAQEVSRIHIVKVIIHVDDEPRASYHLEAVLKADQRLEMISTEIELDEARFLARKIAEWLGIEIECEARP
jgi:hypothetical protein